MTLKHRIIPVLLWDGKTAVQTTKFSSIRPVGGMEQHIENMESRDIDELIILDIAATKEKRKPNFELIKRYAGKLFCPVTYGGGVSTLDDIKRLIQDCGADKISIRTKTPLIFSAAEKFGKQAIVWSVDAGPCEIIKPNEGAGEILVTAIDYNGTQSGYNYSYVRQAVYLYNVPIIINGGCGCPDDMRKAFEAGASACAASTMFLFTEHTPRSCARALRDAGVPVRVNG